MLTALRGTRRGALLLGAVAGSLNAQLRGDSAAVVSVQRMIGAMGGQALWTTSTTLELEYRIWAIEPHPQRITEHAWRDLREPNQWMQLRGDSVVRVTAMTPAGTWRQRNGVLQPISDLEFRQALMFWYRDFYTLLRRFAVGDPDLFVASGSGRRVVVYSDRHGELGWFEIASDGSLVRWGTVDGGEPLEYTYGPMREFGPLRFPAWGTNRDGTWRFEYAAVTLHSRPIDAGLLRRPSK